MQKGRQSLDIINKPSRMLGDQGVRRIFGNKCDKVKQVRLQHNKISWIGMRYFSKANWGSLVLIYLYLNNIGDKGCKYLSQTSIKSLKQLSLRDNQIGSAGVIHLSKAQWKALQVLYLGYNQIGFGGIDSLVDNNWKKLNYLSIASNKIEWNQLIKISLMKSNLIKKLQIWQKHQLINQKDLLKLMSLLSKRFIGSKEIIIKQI